MNSSASFLVMRVGFVWASIGNRSMLLEIGSAGVEDVGDSEERGVRSI